MSWNPQMLAGGTGQPILTGICLADVGCILQDAVPAALLALSAQGVLEPAERWLVPRGLCLRRGIPQARRGADD